MLCSKYVSKFTFPRWVLAYYVVEGLLQNIKLQLFRRFAINCIDKNALSTANFFLILYRHFLDFFMFSTPISWEINLSNLRQQQIVVAGHRRAAVTFL